MATRLHTCDMWRQTPVVIDILGLFAAAGDVEIANSDETMENEVIEKFLRDLMEDEDFQKFLCGRQGDAHEEQLARLKQPVADLQASLHPMLHRQS